LKEEKLGAEPEREMTELGGKKRLCGQYGEKRKNFGLSVGKKSGGSNWGGREKSIHEEQENKKKKGGLCSGLAVDVEGVLNFPLSDSCGTRKRGDILEV